MEKIELGDRVKDDITGLTGIAVGVTEWLFACRRIVVQPETSKDGKPAETFCVDEPQLHLIKRGVIKPQPLISPSPKTGGTRPDPVRRDISARAADPTRR